MSLLHPHPHLHPEPNLHPPTRTRTRTRSTCSRSTSTELTLQDILQLEDLQVEIRGLREEVALLEAKLRLQEGGGAQLKQCRIGRTGDQKLEDVPYLPPLLKTEPNSRTQKRPDGLNVPCGLKNESVEPSYCAYATGLKTPSPDASSLSLQCYTQPEAQDISGLITEDAPQPSTSLSLQGHGNPRSEDSLDSELSGGDPGGLQHSGVKSELVSADCSDGEQDEVKTCLVRLVDCKETLAVDDGIVKQEVEEKVDGYLESSVADVAVQAGMVKSGGPPVPDVGAYDTGTGPMIVLRRPPPNFVPDEHLNMDLMDTDMCSCFWCGKRFPSPSMLRIHLSTHECTGDGPPTPTTSPEKVLQLQIPVKDKLYPCIHCGKTFTDLSHCKSHEKIHTSEGPYRCSQCSASFAFLYGLQNHQKEHTEEPSSIPKPYQCSFCPKQFATRATLIIHRRVHTGERPYQCFFCDQTFTRSDRLKEHIRIHTGEKPYQCNSCGKQFSQSASFRTHQRIHTGEKPYSCSTCGKQFSDLTGLRTHERQHTGEKPYHCFQCGKSFAQASNLRAHHKRHEMEQNPLVFPV
ncbi:zinc finger protein 2-like isoform X1 [Astyanax mexicanus]|uniref:zinc finger protein 2-like isoform X1 n=1 Tax=Astyanax mexicanus TaxID=7994 RepID=UPI0003CD2D06|nr:zinc finger protein 2-like isoform X1 [Astyanax mexicanus]